MEADTTLDVPPGTLRYGPYLRISGSESARTFLGGMRDRTTHTCTRLPGIGHRVDAVSATNVIEHCHSSDRQQDIYFANDLTSRKLNRASIENYYRPVRDLLIQLLRLIQR